MSITGRVPPLLLLGLVAVLLRPEASTVWLWLFTVLALVGLDVLLAPPVGAVSVERLPAGRVRAGHETTSAVTVENTGRRPASLLVRDAWQPTAGASSNRHRLRLRSGDRAVISTPLRPSRRGELAALGVTVRSLGPLGLAARQRTLPAPGGLRVIPPFESRKHLPSRLARLRDLDGRSAVRVRGQGTEFDSLREYVRGDDVRSIDWRASARNRNVVVRTWQPERDRRVVLVLDTSSVSAGRVDDVPRLDSAMDARLLLPPSRRRAGDRVDFVAGDRRVRRGCGAPARATRPPPQDTMADLAAGDRGGRLGALAGAVPVLGRQRALVVLLTPLEPRPSRRACCPCSRAGRPPPRGARVRPRPGARADGAARHGLDECTTPRGASRPSPVGAPPPTSWSPRRRRDRRTADALPPALADHYLALKARGLL
jgi:uncharacterized protein (DUF58 family)